MRVTPRPAVCDNLPLPPVNNCMMPAWIQLKKKKNRSIPSHISLFPHVFYVIPLSDGRAQQLCYAAVFMLLCASCTMLLTELNM